MANTNKNKGDWAERVVLAGYIRNGFRNAARTRAGYERDYGDIHLLKTRALIVQVKNVRTVLWSKWMKQLSDQKRNAGAETAFLVWKPPGVGEKNLRDWLAVMTVKDHAELLRRAGYGEPLDSPAESQPSTIAIADQEGMV